MEVKAIIATIKTILPNKDDKLKAIVNSNKPSDDCGNSELSRFESREI